LRTDTRRDIGSCLCGHITFSAQIRSGTGNNQPPAPACRRQKLMATSHRGFALLSRAMIGAITGALLASAMWLLRCQRRWPRTCRQLALAWHIHRQRCRMRWSIKGDKEW